MRLSLITMGLKNGLGGDMIQEKVMAESWAFMSSRVILTATDIDFFTLLEKKPSTAKDLAERLGLDPKATTRLLDCLVVYGFLKNGLQYFWGLPCRF